MFTITELKLKIIGDLSKLKSDIKELIKGKLKIGVKDVDVGVKEVGERKKGAEVGVKGGLGIFKSILKVLGPIALLLSLKPILDFIKLILNLLLYGIFKILKPLYENVLKPFWDWIKPTVIKILEKLRLIEKEEPPPFEQIAEAMRKIGELEMTPEDVIQQTELFDELAEIRSVLKEHGIDVVNGLDVPIGRIRSILEKNGIDTSKFSDEQLRLATQIGDITSKELGDISDHTYNLEKDFLDFGESVPPALEDIEERIEEEAGLVEDLSDNMTTTKEAIVDEIGTSTTDTVSALSDVETEVSDTIDKLELMRLLLVDLPTLIGDVISTFLDRIIGWGKSLWGGGDEEEEEEPDVTVTDAIIKPSGKVIRTHPQDTLIATRNPDLLGGVTNKTLNFYGVTPEQMIEVIKRELGVDVFRSSRF